MLIKKKIARTARITLDNDMTLFLALQEIGFQRGLIFSEVTSYMRSNVAGENWRLKSAMVQKHLNDGVDLKQMLVMLDQSALEHT